MSISERTQRLLTLVQQLLPVDDDEIVQRGIIQATLDRIVEIRRRAAQLADAYTSLEALEARVQAEGTPPGDHTLYTDLLEWRAVRHELAQLTDLLERA